MVLDRILTDPDELDSTTAMLTLVELAAELSMSLERASLWLPTSRRTITIPGDRWSSCAQQSEIAAMPSCGGSHVAQGAVR
ncbi:hypothetical protein ABZW96_35430 [Nocardia sp. NPDC004168]|uniref:hypothetical protein n=1 Tax=Nocardia sp. NPDC004168 TaxID=3154452 RepID=UPI0033A7778B